MKLGGAVFGEIWRELEREMKDICGNLLCTFMKFSKIKNIFN